MEINEKQLQIIQVAEKLFSEQGYDGTSVRQIAKEAEVNVAMISYYFGSKEKLLEVLITYRLADFKLDLIGIINQEEIDFYDRLNRVIATLIRRIHNNRHIYAIIHSESSNNTRNLTLDHYRDQKRENFEIFENFIVQGQEAGFFSKSIDIPLLIPTLIGTYFHFHYNLEFFKEIYGLENESKIQSYVETILTNHLQNLIKSLLNHEN